MKPSILTSLFLAATLHAQPVLYSENFSDGVLPTGWTARFGFVTADPLGSDPVLSFRNRAAGKDTFSSALDLSGVTSPTLSFDFYSAGTTNHPLLVGLSADLLNPTFFAGSEAAAATFNLTTTFAGTGAWEHLTFDLAPWLTSFNTLDLPNIRIAFLAWNNSAVSFDHVFIDNISVTNGIAPSFASSAGSAIPEPSTYAAICGCGALFVAFLKRRAK